MEVANRKSVHLAHMEFIDLIDDLVEKIYKSDIKFDHIVGLSRGGIVPAGYISYRLGNIPVTCLGGSVGYPLSQLHNLFHANILVVDNIATSGSTLAAVMADFQELQRHGVLVGTVKFCTVFARDAAIDKIDFCARQVGNDEQVVFPWQSGHTEGYTRVGRRHVEVAA